MSKLNVKEIPIQIGIIRNDFIIYYTKDTKTGSKQITYEEYEKMIK